MAHSKNYSMSNVFPILPEEYIQNHLSTIKIEWQRRWDNILSYKNSFEPYRSKSHDEIIKEFESLQKLRQGSWYKDPETNPHVSQKDYLPAQNLIEKGFYRTIGDIAFAYNNTNKSYNASTILLRGHHFIALQEPATSSLNQFFKLLINYHACVLVRLKPEEEFLVPGSIKYWENRLRKEKEGSLLEMIITESVKPTVPVCIPYFYTNDWVDNKALHIPTLYQLVCQVQQFYNTFSYKGPIACHCASGVGRTGTFIAAYVLADMIQKSPSAPLSIEQMVLELSLQRPNLVANVEQYLSLYQFVEYCLAHSC